MFVGVHGASIPNSFFMRPGSALVEALHPAWPCSVSGRPAGLCACVCVGGGWGGVGGG